MSTAATVIQKFGGIRPMARIIGKPASTVQGWMEAGYIPSRHLAGVLSAAEANGIGLTCEELIGKTEAA